ncbi:FAD-dependent oxidoreductase [Synechococcus sp. Cruz-9H2]|uniref:FAD-dependent oxidoreductase n=1 Tax=unclassified Synechococcus TaxID=2626047 RepID=UPI0020CF23ED|nr:MULTISPECIES: FAD-dependent oxidoreductase [unclassified Synechococcus]MCP9819691.1 FAD-dependent oxidoreductase [Synechococcus sp. Cruz-9H2]MCP9843996.1 FAD-dependent oxidoreductase [Synechococcus sp. Edmonson 11F2]MCP9856121.1 FAD-dependent oxidoreductase [Synechococcus sp. Cruz-9C9]MCP9863405.1 FAD-dependent oxidoreductase [Synechococcus sp. Cruz-7E5]MCP9870568.1 FAD-dependent oxidoreductase [Synechococcus sp. Cruz-7B9]
MTTAPDSQPVVIVGAGPAGTSLAMLLAERGVKVTLVEAARDFQRQFRGEGLMPSGLAALEAMGCGPVLARLPQRSLSAWSFHLHGRELFRVEEPLESHRPCTLISQPALLEALLERASRASGFQWSQGLSVVDLIEAEGRVAGVVLSDGSRLAASLVVASDGRSSLVRQRSGLKLERQSSPIDLLWFRLPSHPRFESDNAFTMLLGEDGAACSLFHGALPGELQLGWVLSPGERIERSPQAWGEAFAAMAPDWLADHLRQVAPAISAPLKLSVQVGCCRRWHRPGLLLLGDAAHPMSPIRAQGINMALRDAVVAANQLLAPLMAGDTAAIDASLEQIQAERLPEIQRAQTLQQQEARQAQLLRRSPLLRRALVQLAPWLGERIGHFWRQRQIPLRQGLATVQLTV